MRPLKYTLAALCMACAAQSNASGSLLPAMELTPDERALLSTRLDGSTRPQLSIAMSGGGIRSSLFNLGVLKALYDKGILEEADVISSVSGGSYTSYWLYRNQLDAPQLAFGQRALADEHFPERVCEIITSGNFVTYWDMIWAAKTGSRGLRNMYLRELLNTYGGNDSIAAPYLLDELSPHVQRGTMPYLIVNTSINSGAYRKQQWSNRLFEFTPIHYGNRSQGFVRWGEREHQLHTAAITSGAALGPLDRRFFKPFPTSTANNYVDLGDGGKTENLGAVAPILRGSERVIVIDAQLDPPDEPFQAYHRLKSHLAGLGLEMTVPGIEQPDEDKPSVFEGEVRGTHGVSTIIYVKMAVPKQLRLAFASPSATTTMQGNDFEARYYKTLRDSAQGGRWDCGKVSTFLGDFRSWMFQNTSNYLAWSEGRGIYRTLTRALPDQQEFPQHSTADQSFYLDQAVGYIGLGYLVASSGEGARLLPKHPQATAGALAQPVSTTAP